MTAILAHRGAWGACRENTLEAFRHARALGAHGVELDVRRTGDGVLVVHHDPVLPDGRVLATVAQAELPGWVPTLEAAFEECAGLLVDAEIKNLPTEPGFDPGEAAAAGTAALARRLGVAAQVVVSSFSLTSADAARAAGAGVSTGWLTLAGYDQLDALALAADHGHDALLPRHEVVTPELVAAVHARGMRVHAWTVDDPDRVRVLAGAGVDVLITNVPDVALRALRR
ncbi:MAG: glycerophosphodiester phosphodiesterase [Actinomycetota bacterium]